MQQTPSESNATPLSATILPPESRSKPSPSALSGKQQVGNLQFAYALSPSGVDSNLLVFLHGLGDNEKPFFQLGQQLQNTLPQTAVLSLRAPKQVPALMLEEARTWWDTFTPWGDTLPDQNPAKFCEAFGKLLDCLTAAPASASSSTSTPGCGWAPQHIHLFGFGQGGTAALEGAIHWALSRRQKASSDAQRTPEQLALGSVVSVSGGLLRHPTFTPPVPTRVLYVHRSPKASAAGGAVLKTLERAFGSERVTECRMSLAKTGANEEISEAMPRAKEGEWDPIIRWWAGKAGWRNRTEMEMRDDGSVMRIA